MTAPRLNFLYSNSISRLCDEASSIESALDESPRRFSWFCASDAVPASITRCDHEPATAHVVDPLILPIRCPSPDGAALIRDGLEERSHGGCRSLAWAFDQHDQSAAETMAISA